MPRNPIVRAKVPLRSGFDKSHHALLTTKVGTITPLLVDEVVANSKLSLAMALSASLPPLAVDTFMKVDFKTEAFFVPMRLLYGGFEDYFCDNQIDVYTGVSSENYIKTNQTPRWPKVTLSGLPDKTIFGAGTLADYLGIKGNFTPTTGSDGVNLGQFSLLPFIAYHKIYDDWYRNTLVQKPIFLKGDGYQGSTSGYSRQAYLPARLPYLSLYNSSYDSIESAAKTDASAVTNKFADGVMFWELRQRNFGFDYFTNCTPDPSYRYEGTVTVSDGAFTISALRAANSLQMFGERNNLAGARFADVLNARYGADLSAGVAQRSVFLGSASYPVYSRGVSVSGENAGVETNNPFSGNAGAQVGQGFASGSDKLVDNYTAQEPGFLFVMGTLVPKVTYASGTRRYLKHGLGNITDFATPLLQNVGNQPVYQYEVSNDAAMLMVTPAIFGYTDRYAEYMSIEDRVHGLIIDGESLDSFAAQRYFDGSGVEISSEFLQIPTDYLDNVTAVQSTLSEYGVWIDVDFKYHVSMPLAEYSLPSLQDPAYEHGQTVEIHRGGFRF